MIYPLEARLPSTPDATSSELLDRFLDYLSEMNLDLYPAQEEAILALFDGQNVILNTPTGSGKSLVATALHFSSWARQRRSIYTCPIKALVNEKFFALCRLFGPKNVGMTTGDASVNPDAPILCCTAEILANIALRQGSSAPAQDIVMDEFHYYADRDRGVAWQVPLLTLDYSRFLLMTATLGDPKPFESLLHRKTGKETVTISSSDRPVPLDFKYSEEPLSEALNTLVTTGQAPIYLVNFTQQSAAEQAQSLLSMDYSSKEEKKAINEELKGYRFKSPYGKELARILRHGIGIHHAGLLPKYRLLVEKLAQKGLLKVISGTDTLGVGINVPIRSVIFTQICKFDGQKTTLLSVRDFQQISGRAGRKGFDDRGTVVVQAPEHVIENKQAESKTNDPKKLKKLKKKQPPTKGYVHWDEQTFQKLITSPPEALRSSFQVSHGMLLNILSRGDSGCQSMKQLLRDCQESDVLKQRHRKQAFRMFRSLLERKIVEFVPTESSATSKTVRVNFELQDDFSIFQSLAIWLLDSLALLDTTSPEYALDIITLVESIQENPRIILLRQVDRAKNLKMRELKERGVDFEERVALLEEVTYPKPNEQWIYDTFNAFVRDHPWLDAECIRPKSIAREMFEQYMSFDEYIKEYSLERAEGVLLRYLSQVYKGLSQSVPESFHTPEFLDVTSFFRAIVKNVDSSLIDEWENMGRSAEETLERSQRADEDDGALDITADLTSLTILVRNEVFKILRLISQGRYQKVVEEIDPSRPDGLPPWTAIELSKRIQPFFDEHGFLRTDGPSRHKSYFKINRSPAVWQIKQTLIDPEEVNNWLFSAELDWETTQQNQEVKLRHIDLLQE